MRTLVVTAGLISEGGRILIAQRRQSCRRGLLWEFPGGKVKEDEDPRQALRRELNEELGIEVEVGRLFDVVFCRYPEYPILLLVYLCRVTEGEPKPLQCLSVRWVNPAELEGFPMPLADDLVRKKVLTEEGYLGYLKF